MSAAIAAVMSRVAARDRGRDSARHPGRDAGHDLEHDSGRALARAAETLSARYRAADETVPARPLTDAERAAYLIVRAPATYAAISAVLRELGDRCPQLDAHRLLDLGAGPGVGAWAALARWPDITHVTLIERDRGFATLGREILEASGLATGRTIDWQSRDLRDLPAPARVRPAGVTPASATPVGDTPTGATQAEAMPADATPGPAALGRATPRRGAPTPPAPARSALAGPAPARQEPETLPRCDLVLMSYVLSELPPEARARALDAAWQATTGALVLIEPGTPRHFAAVLDARAWLLQRGATIAAPCPHHGPCPMAAAGDWCHVSARLSRTRQHRQLKDARLSYEDEKFSYLIATRVPTDQASARIVRHPQFEKGRVTLTLCTPAGLTTEAIGRRARETYRRARKAHWGDPWAYAEPVEDPEPGASGSA